MDSLGNMMMTGQFFSATVDFGGGPLSNAGARDIFVAKYDPSGQHLWSKRFGGGSHDSGSSIAVDSGGDVLLIGNFNGTVDFGGGPLTGIYDIFVAKYDSSGQHLWSKRFGGPAEIDRGTDVAVDAAGNVLVIGTFRDTVDFGGGPLTSAGLDDIFLAKYDSTGQHLWSKRFGGTGNDSVLSDANDIVVGAAGKVLVAGVFEGTADFGGGPLTSAGTQDIFLAKYDSTGQHLWSKRFGGVEDDSEVDVAMDATDNVLLTGGFLGTADFGGGPLTSAGLDDIFIAKYDASGQHLWSKRFGDAQSERGHSVDVDSADNVLLTGDFFGTVDFGGGPITSAGAGNWDAFVAKYDASGQHLWSQRFASDISSHGVCIQADSSDNLLLLGSYLSTQDFGGGPLTSVGGSTDIFLVKFAP